MRQNIITCLISGCLVIIMNYISDDDSKVDRFFSYMGAVALFIGFSNLIQFLTGKYHHYKKIKKLADIYDAEQMDCTYIFTDDGITYSDKEKSFSCKWRVIDGYSLFSNYIIFHICSKRSSEIVISRAKFSEEEFLIVFEYLKELKQNML